MGTTLFWIITQRVRPAGGPETSVRIYHYSLPNNPEEGSSLLCEFCVFCSSANEDSVRLDITPRCLRTQATHCPTTRCNIPEELNTKYNILPVDLSQQTIPFHFDRYLTEYQTTLYLVLEFGSLALAN
jgi:hypothetical protein